MWNRAFIWMQYLLSVWKVRKRSSVLEQLEQEERTATPVSQQAMPCRDEHCLQM